MRVLELAERFGLDALRLAERPEPRPGPDQVAIEVRAASLNYRDLMMVRGEYDPRQPLPLVPGSDAAGVVLELGEGVRGLRPGDRVATLFAQRWQGGEPTIERIRSTLGGPLDGTLAERMVLDSAGVVPVPEHLTDSEAATLTCAALTAWSALVTHGGVRPGDTVVIEGTGGVALFALQFSVLAGARAIVLSSSVVKRQRAVELGAWQTLDYRDEPEWGRLVRELNGGQGVDHVVDVGGAATLVQALSAVRPGGTVSVIGVLGGGELALGLAPVFMKQVRLQGVFVGSRDGFLAMNRAIEAARLRPVIDREFPLAEGRAAFGHLASGRHFGKVVVRVTT